ncbi:hypothetical protein BDY19DRAFT_906612 [Irpex rosettiformis]|uniref:Uncharacterized protein n=1 Tax=Irpex rosettiformis TaxID=378272 RepID=A0ACB8U300_9APHY|nr:hypothetical protein BDY19DRAFT_906612 [Irpex rosettiformis]
MVFILNNSVGESASASLIAAQSDVTHVVGLDGSSMFTYVEVHNDSVTQITTRTIMGVLAAIAGFAAIVLTIVFLHRKRRLTSGYENHELPGTRRTVAPPGNDTHARQSWSYAVQPHGEQLPRYSRDGHSMRAGSAALPLVPGAPPPAYIPGDSVHLPHNGRAL